MQQFTKGPLSIASVVLIALLMGSTSTWASGSFRANAASGAKNGDYLLGKRVLYKKLLCSKCPFERKVLKSRKKSEIMLLELESNQQYAGLISSKETNAVKQYFKLRFR